MTRAAETTKGSSDGRGEWRWLGLPVLVVMSLACGGRSDEAVGAESGLTSSSNGGDVDGSASSSEPWSALSAEDAAIAAQTDEDSSADASDAWRPELADSGLLGDASIDGDAAAPSGMPEASTCVPGVVSSYTFALGMAPTSIVVQDFNGDHIPDVAVADDPDVSVLLGRGDGTLGSPTSYTMGPGTTLLAAGDLNGDGITDLVADGSSGILFGNGDGTFTPYLPNGTLGISAAAEMVADATGDGRPDLIIVDFGEFEGELYVLPGNGDGTFGARVETTVPTDAYTATVGYFNDDRNVDVAIGYYFGVEILLGHGDGTFDVGGNYFTNMSPRGLATVDLNRDAKTDLVLASSAEKAIAGLGAGDGTFPSAGQSGYRLDASARSVAVADLNGDGILDLVVGTSLDEASQASDLVDVLIGNGDGTFEAPLVIKAGSDPEAVVVADMNGDGQTDIVVANYGDASVSVLLLDPCGGALATPAPPSLCAAGGICTASEIYFCASDGTDPCEVDCRCDAGEPLSCTGCSNPGGS